MNRDDEILLAATKLFMGTVLAMVIVGLVFGIQYILL